MQGYVRVRFRFRVRVSFWVRFGVRVSAMHIKHMDTCYATSTEGTPRASAMHQD